MKTENAVLMEQAREALNGKWGLSVGVVLVYIAVVMAAQFFPNRALGGVVSLFVTPPMALGLTIFFLRVSRNQEAGIENMLDGFKIYLKVLGAYLLMALIIVAGIILLIVPGIIAAFMLSMTFFILADEPEIEVIEALKKSRAMMAGNKMKFFFLQLRFLGWALLCILTLGIGLLWLIPYMQVSFSKFYDDINGRQAVAEIITPEVIPAV